MFRTHLGPNVDKKVLWKWCFLGFVSGQINAGGFLATGRFVSHMTGFGTLIGIEAGKGNWATAIELFTVPFYFLLGALISGYLIELPILKERQPRFDRVMILVVTCLFLCALGGGLNLLGTFGQNIHVKDEYVIMALLCLACGLQNAAISSSTNGKVRVTHLTGLTTDVGLGLVRWWTLKSNPETAEKEKMMSRFRVGMFAAFASGSAVATVFYLHFGYYGFLLPTVCSIYTLFEAKRAIREKSEYLL